MEESKLLIVVHAIPGSYIHLEVTKNLEPSWLLRVNRKKRVISLSIVRYVTGLAKRRSQAEKILGNISHGKVGAVVTVLHYHTSHAKRLLYGCGRSPCWSNWHLQVNSHVNVLGTDLVARKVVNLEALDAGAGVRSPAKHTVHIAEVWKTRGVVCCRAKRRGKAREQSLGHNVINVELAHLTCYATGEGTDPSKRLHRRGTAMVPAPTPPGT
uniref:Capsid protein n=1 Tax=Cressdnaviricota sp. TaxID=2748378 RepID=A0A6M4BC87_9VIRU|nr:capsid protein [Cressdnaviricota sp.]